MSEAVLGRVELEAGGIGEIRDFAMASRLGIKS